MRLLHFLQLALAFAHEGHDHDEQDEGPSDVITLTDKSLPDFLKENDLSLVEFYARN
jgi:hypothetical protein